MFTQLNHDIYYVQQFSICHIQHYNKFRIYLFHIAILTIFTPYTCDDGPVTVLQSVCGGW